MTYLTIIETPRASHLHGSSRIQTISDLFACVQSAVTSFTRYSNVSPSRSRYNPIASITIWLLIMIHSCHATGLFPDAYMVCEEPLPADNAGWPPGYSAYQYLDNIDLCSAFMGHRIATLSRNVGCLCPSDEASLWCSTQYGDPNFYPLPTGRGALMANGQSWSDFWTAHCRCTNEDIAEGYRSHNAAGEAVFSTQYPANMYNFVLPYGTAAEPDGDESVGSTGLADANNASLSDRSNHTEICSYPPLQCTSSASCSSTGGSDCLCRVTGTQFVQAGVFKHFTACGMQSLRSRKRGNEGETHDVPCACNGTYVSYKCCSAGVDGLVWEPADTKLGEVMLPEDF